MRRLTWSLLALAFPVVPIGCGTPGNEGPPPASEVQDSRTEEAREADDGMEKHFKKFGNR